MKIPKARQLPSGMWRVQLRLGGESINILRPKEKDAIKAAELVKAQYHNDIKVPISISAKLYDVIDDYIRSRSSVISPSMLRGYQAYQRTRFLAYMDRPVNSINWQRAVNEEAKLCSPKTLKNAWGLVRSSLATVGLDVTVRLPAQVPHEKEWLTMEEIHLFLDAIKGTPGEIGALLALSSLRRSEIYGLEWKDIDLDKGLIHIHQSLVLGEKAVPVLRQQNKTTASTRTIPIMLDQLFDALSAVEDKTGPVVPGNVGTLRKRISRACASAGLPDVGVHGLRHSFASMCYSLGVSELGAMQLGGWSDYQTMRKIYTHLSEKDRDQSATTISSFLNNAHKNAHEELETQ